MIEIKDLSVSLNNYQILDKINLCIDDNEYVAIMGSSGSGKTTLLNIMGLLEKPTAGKILIDGKDFARASNKERVKLLRNEIGFVFQDFGVIDDMTVYENLVFCLPKSKNRREVIQKALLAVDLQLDLDKKVYLLSGGERQRIAIARLLLKKCNYILCDEPTGSIDEENSQNIVEIFKRLQREKKTIIMVTHDKAIARQADRIIYLDELKK